MIIKNVAKVVILDGDNNVLLLRRSATDPQRPGEWDFPGGGVDAGEDFAAAASREIREEAGLIVEQDDLRLVYTATTSYEEDENKSVNRFLFIARLATGASGDVTLSFEHDFAKWVTIDDALLEFPHPFYGVGLKYALEHALLA